jgi:hypothetical protein
MEQDDEHQTTGVRDRLSPPTPTEISCIAGTGAQAQYDLTLKFERGQWPQWKGGRTEHQRVP